MIFSFHGQPSLELHGYSPDQPATILAKVSGGATPSQLRGDFVLVADGLDQQTRKPLTVFVTTAVGAVPYYYHSGRDRFVHADNVFDCARLAGLPWRWNWQALAQLATFDHLLADHSLHADIHKVPPCCVMVVRDGSIKVHSDNFWHEIFRAGKAADPKAADEVVCELLAEMPNNAPCALALSAGYDSRVLLACLNRLGIRPATATMGAPQSTDARIAEELAAFGNLPFRRIDLLVEDYTQHADRILQTTSGEKTFWHWHTGIYAAKIDFEKSAVLLAGANGEFARSYYYDRGLWAESLDRVPFDLWRFHLSRKYSASRALSKFSFGKPQTNSHLGRYLDSTLMLQESRVPDGLLFGDGLDCFYGLERVRNFIGLGLALYRTAYKTMSPFLDARFVRYAAQLSRSSKLNSRLHRSIVSEASPRLLDFPTDDSGEPMGKQEHLLYYRRPRPHVSYNKYSEAVRHPQILELARRGFYTLGGQDARFLNEPVADALPYGIHFLVTVGGIVRLTEKLGLATS